MPATRHSKSASVPKEATNGNGKDEAEVVEETNGDGEEEVAEADGDEGESVEGEEEYEVDQVMDHRKEGVKYRYLVSWKGYGSEHNTWEPQDNLDHASDLVSAYWAKQPKTELGVKKRNRPSTSSQPPARATKAPRASNGRAGAKVGRALPKDDEDDLDAPNFNSTHVDSVDKYEDVKDWEEVVQSIDTIEKGSDGKLMVYMTMDGGEKCSLPTEVAYKRCPQKILLFYQAHLKWRVGEP